MTVNKPEPKRYACKMQHINYAKSEKKLLTFKKLSFYFFLFKNAFFTAFQKIRQKEVFFVYIFHAIIENNLSSFKAKHHPF